MIVLLMLLGVPARIADSTATQRIQALGDRVWHHQLEQSGLARLRHGLPVDRLPDLSLAGARLDSLFWRSVGRAVATIPDRGLSDEDRRSKSVMSWLAARGVEASPFFWFTSNRTPYSSPVTGVHRLFGALPLANAADRSRYLALIWQYPALIDTIRKKLEGQVARRLVLPKPELALVVPLWRSFLKPPRQSPVWVDSTRLTAASPGERTAFEGELERLITNEVNPRLERLIEYIEGPYAAAAPSRVGLWRYARGREYYRYLVRFHTTMTLTPEEVFATGKREIDSLTKELDRVRQATGFQGTLTEFKQSLRTDPRFFVSTPEEVGRRLDGFAAQMETKLDSLFGRRSKAPYGTARLAPELEPNMTYGFYDEPKPARPKGIYFFNGSKLNERNLAMAEGLTYHELVPGHHFQITLNLENRDLPRFRQDLYLTAHGEGWGDYSSMLGADAGLYQDPYSRAGRLMMEMMLGNRLALDAGMSYFGWTLERARQFMREHTLETETQIATETLRYGVDMPGQALAYRMGSLAFRRFRERARHALGDRFDIRRYHDFVLSVGPLPMDVLSQEVDRFVSAVH